jgi:CelD/BcsL family acetyltransferase involved in cellulose biosynthesis
MDFGYGDSEYKRQFSNQTTRQVNVSLFRKSLYTGAALVTHSAFARLMRTGRWLLDLTGKREVMRRMLRRR